MNSHNHCIFCNKIIIGDIACKECKKEMLSIRKLVYCATPSNMQDKTKEIMESVIKKGFIPVHPHQMFPFELFEGGLIS